MRLTLRRAYGRIAPETAKKGLRSYDDLFPALDRALSGSKRAKMLNYDLSDIATQEPTELEDFIDDHISDNSLDPLPPEVLKDVDDTKKNEDLKANHTGPTARKSDVELSGKMKIVKLL